MCEVKVMSRFMFVFPNKGPQLDITEHYTIYGGVLVYPLLHIETIIIKTERGRGRVFFRPGKVYSEH